jgi:hypothetical protein
MLKNNILKFYKPNQPPVKKRSHFWVFRVEGFYKAKIKKKHARKYIYTMYVLWIFEMYQDHCLGLYFTSDNFYLVVGVVVKKSLNIKSKHFKLSKSEICSKAEPHVARQECWCGPSNSQNTNKYKM